VCGTSRALRARFPALHTIGVDTHGSVLFGLPDEGKRLLRGLGNSLMPKNVDHTAFDEIHWVRGEEGFRATRELHRRHDRSEGAECVRRLLADAGENAC
jgi:cysteine synthase A